MSENEDQPKEAGGASPPGRSFGSELGSSSAIGRRLKAYYDDVASEPVPDRFLSLLDALDAAESDGARARDRGSK